MSMRIPVIGTLLVDGCDLDIEADFADEGLLLCYHRRLKVMIRVAKTEARWAIFGVLLWHAFLVAE